MAGRTVSARTRVYLRSRAQAHMLNTVQILRVSGPQLNNTTGVVTTNTTSTIYTGIARVWEVSGSGVLMLGEAPIDTRTTQISIPFDDTGTPPRRDDIVKVTAEATQIDNDLTGRTFRVMEVDGGGLMRVTRRLTCVSWYPDRHWGE